MSILLFLLACALGSGLGMASRPSTRELRLIPLAALLAAFASALFIRSTTILDLGDVTLTGSQYSGIFLACAAGSALLLCLVALAAGWRDEFAPAALASLAGLAVATTSPDAGVALMAGAAAATSGALVMSAGPRRSDGIDARLSEIRTIALVSAALLFAGIALLRPAWTGKDGPVFVLAFIGLALALAVRSGAVPFHVPAVHLHRSASPVAPALLLVWIPAGLGLLVVSWSATTFAINDDALNGAVAAVKVVAVATLVLGALAALVHDEIDEVVTYSIVADAGFILLAVAARSDAAAEPTRLWLLAFVAAKTGLVAWAAAMSRAFGTSNVTLLRGWLRRTPLLGLALVAIAVATIGLPGGAVYNARSALISLALPSQLQILFAASILLSAAYIVRLLVVGLLPAGEAVRGCAGEKPRMSERAHVAPATAAEVAPEVTPIVEVATALDAAPEVAAAVAPPVAVATALDAAPEPTFQAATTDAPDAGQIEPTTPAGRARLAAIWHLNRTLEVSLVVVAGAFLAAALAFGGLGANNASNSGIPLDAAAHATPGPPRGTPASGSTATPQPTLAPRPSVGPASSGASPSAGPSGSPTPIKTSAPARDNTD